MKKLLFSCLLFLFIADFASATHIVGGGFSYRHISGNQYRFTLTLYFDFINGSVGAKDQFALCHIFRRFDNQYMDSLYMPLSDSTTFVNYSNPGCGAIVDLKTQVLTYSRDVILSNERYNSTKGYYIIWERCCRNHIISNIMAPNATGQTFYMEFPPVFKSGQPFINSSPVFLPVTADFPCINQEYQNSFQALDEDGDQLVYTLTNPLKGNSSQVTPRGVPPIPAPYDPVDWMPGFGGDFPIPGNPGLSVHPATGMLTCNAILSGLFVFSVKCEEFRAGLKIGEVRREMQIPVVDCPANDPPVIVLNNEQGVRLGEDDTLNLETRDQDFCIPLKISDIQRNTSIRFNLKVLSGPADLQDSSLYFIGNDNDSASARFCLPSCTVTPENEPWKIRLVASDDGCPEPFSDTLMVFLNIRKSPIQAPEVFFEANHPDTIALKQKDILSIPIIGRQNQEIPITMSSRIFLPNGQVLPSWQGILLPSGSGNGEIRSKIQFTGLCRIPPGGRFKLETIVKAVRCDEIKNDTIEQWFRMAPDFPILTLQSGWNGLSSIFLGERGKVEFDVKAEISDGSQLFLLPQGSLTFEPGFSFTGPNSGFGKLNGKFSFIASCDGNSGKYDLQFVARGQNCDSVILKTLSYDFDLRYEDANLGTPPNLITCNADQANDYFSLEKIVSADNCASEFDFVEIFNRWGRRVFLEQNRDFRWVPEDFSEGLYYYCLHFKRQKPLNGWLQLVKNTN
jgi:hypothetical protein